MVAYADAGPLKGTVWPILISVSVAPVSYFFCAKAGEAVSAIASAVPMARWKKPFLMSCAFLPWVNLWAGITRCCIARQCALRAQWRLKHLFESLISGGCWHAK